MKKAAGIITNRGGRTCHAAIVAREMGIPAIVGTENCLEKLKTGMIVTVACAEGDIGHVYEGSVPFEVTDLALSDVPKTRTKVMLNLADPDFAFKSAMLPNDGVGLARMEFIINSISAFIRWLLQTSIALQIRRSGGQSAAHARLAHPQDYFVANCPRA